MWPFKKKNEVSDEIAKLILLGKTCYGCRHSMVGRDLFYKGSSTSSAGHNPCLAAKNQRYGVCEIWHSINEGE